MNKELTILTRHYPPNKNINGVLACEMAEFLLNEHNIKTNIVCIDTNSAGNKSKVNPIGNIIRIKPLMKGKNKFSRLISLIFDGYSIIKYAKKHFSNTLIICTTSPPLLPFWASKVLRNNSKWALWSLDLFPEGFAANSQLSKNSILYKYLFQQTYKTPPNYLIALGNKQADSINLKYKTEIPVFILPAGVLLNKDSIIKSKKPYWYDENKIILGYFGNIGIAHNKFFILAILKNITDSQKFILSCYGVFSDDVKKIAKKYKNVTIITGGIPEEELSFIDIHLVSLNSRWTHTAVPSKAVSAISSGRPILFCGSNESDNWQMFKDAGWFINDNENIEQSCIKFLENISKEQIYLKAKNTFSINKSLQEKVINTYNSIAEIIVN